jgi:coenzyme F420-reducing hydrogenase delta subunit
MNDTQTTTAVPESDALPGGRSITVFICANAARGAVMPTSGRRLRPSVPAFDWPCAATEVLVPCTGRLQPEHLLKALEQGADAVCIVACDEVNCHNLEGSRRAKRRAEFVGKLAEEVGLGAGRVILLHLPGSAREDMALGASVQPQPAVSPEELAARVQAIRDEVVSRLKNLAPNPLRKAAPIAAAGGLGEEEVEETDDNED